MKVKIIAASILLMAGAGVQAADGVKISGYIDTNIERISNGDTSKTRISSGGLNASRLVFSGEEDLGGGTKAVFNHELQFDSSTGVGPSPRQSFVGLVGNFGALTLGRQNTPSYWIAGYADPTWSADYSMVSNMQFFFAPFRENNSLSYVTPSVNGFKGRFMATAGQEDGTKNGRYVSTGIEYRNGPLFAAAVSDLKYTKNIFVANTIGSSRDNYFSLAYQFGDFEPTLVYHNYNGYYAFPPFVDFQSKGWDVQLGARYNINQNNRVYASYVHKKDNNNVKLSDADGLVVGYINSLSRRTDLYTTYARVNHKNNTPIRYPVSFSDNPAANSNPSGFQVGIRHAF